MNITADLNRSFQLEQDGLRNEDFPSLGAKVTDLGLEQLDLLAWATAPHLQEAIDYRVEIDVVLVRHCEVSSILPDEAMAREEGGFGSDRQIPKPTERNLKKEGRRERKPAVMIHFWQLVRTRK
jgi:hypothetical protein